MGSRPACGDLAMSGANGSGQGHEGRNKRLVGLDPLCSTHQDVYKYLPFLSLLNFIASSKSEGSPSQRLENTAKKPEDKKEVFRPLKPAVRITQNQFYLFQVSVRSFYYKYVVERRSPFSGVSLTDWRNYKECHKPQTLLCPPNLSHRKNTKERKAFLCLCLALTFTHS